MRAFLGTGSNIPYYEGDQVHPLDQEVPQRPAVNHTWTGVAWQAPDPVALLDAKAQAWADVTDKVQFRLLFQYNNRLRALEGKVAQTPAQFRQDVIDLYKLVNP